MFNIVAAVALLFFCCLSIPGATAAPFDKRTNTQLVTHCTVPNTVALTFDDGPFDYLNDVVDTLKAAGAKGTFFFNGKNWRCIYDEPMAKRALYAHNNGFQIGSHTWAHANLTSLSREQVNVEMSRTEDAIFKITGVLPAFTRPPYGVYNQDTLDVAAARGQTLVNWDFDPQDALKAPVERQKQAFDEAAQKHPTNFISIQHEVFNTTVYDVLPHAIRVLQGAGYKLVTLAECLDRKPYLKVESPSPRDGSWKC